MILTFIIRSGQREYRGSSSRRALVPAPGTHGQVAILKLLVPLGTDGCIPELLLLSDVGDSFPLKVLVEEVTVHEFC